MIDFHSHILPNIDDGSISMEETINIINEAKQAGFTKIILTSHYIPNYYECNELERTKLMEQVKNRLDVNSSADLQLYLGNEIYISNEITKLINEKKASTINNTKYVLFELPMNTKPLFTKEVIFKLIENGYKPIIAHPERYSYVQKNIQFVEELADMGALFQSNYGSIIGMYGNKAKKTLKKLLKKDMISFLGSDVHRTNQIYPEIPKILKKLGKIISHERLEELTTLNAQKVLGGKFL